MPLLDGPRLPPRSGRPADALVVFLHGYGADGRDLIDLGDAFAELLPNAAFLSPHAPFPCDQMPIGRQWFPLALADPHAIARDALGALPALARFLDDERTALGLPWDRVALFGFSQGAMLALAFAVTAPEPLAAVVGASGFLPPVLGEKPPQARPPVLLMHGGRDEVVPAYALPASEAALAKAGVPVETYLAAALGHGLDAAGIARAGRFLAAHLPPRPPA
ncbi:alpha/beta hydrolase [Azorhizobium doebereinerae]|uniref:alpha/beta hydrolase n=1 Tax=Azorhizobium doebereinerae TaxID=281091 RepID=UPI00040A17F7|nr:alpha/beta fold hydrolase [Azorhizobium doebereinerae]